MTSHNDIVFSAPAQLPQTPGLQAVMQAIPEARIVGGAVRDGLLGLPIADVDLASPLLPTHVLTRLSEAGLRAEPTGLAHGTITAISAGQGFEITTLRRDERTDGRHADVTWTGDWQADAARRDFTMNALYQSADGKIWDYVGGLADLRAGHVRFVGDPAARIAEDYLRILRFFRFQARYGRDVPNPDLLNAIGQGAPGLQRLSVERIWSEWRNILAGPDPLGAAMLMEQTGVLPYIMPEGVDIGRLRRLIEKHAPPDPLLRLAALLTGDDRVLAKRLKLSNEQSSLLHGLLGAAVPTSEMDDRALRRLLADTTKALLIGRIWLADYSQDQAIALCHRLEALELPVFPLQGADLLTVGTQAGPQIGIVLRQIRDWWLEGGCVADKEMCLFKAAKLLTN